MDDKQKALQKLQEHFGDRIGLLGFTILTLSMSGQPCDVTFYKRKPAIDVKIDSKITLAIIYGAGPKKMAHMLENIKLSNGEVASITEIWTVHPMPEKGFSDEELAAVNLADGDGVFGQQGETIREMIRNVYHCVTKNEEDNYLRRYLAS